MAAIDRMYLPKQCPSCGTPFSSVIAPKPRWQFMAVVVLLISIALTIIGLGGSAYASVKLNLWEDLTPRGSIAMFIGVIFVGAMPGSFVMHWAMRMPLVVRLQCKRCRWSEQFQVKSATAKEVERNRAYAERHPEE